MRSVAALDTLRFLIDQDYFVKNPFVVGKNDPLFSRERPVDNDILLVNILDDAPLFNAVLHRHLPSDQLFHFYTRPFRQMITRIIICFPSFCKKQLIL